MITDLDQVLAQYREHLRKVATLLSQISHLGQHDGMLSKDAEEMIEKLEKSVAKVMDKKVMVERERQAVLDLGMILDISRQTVEAKSKHLGQEEKQKEEAQTLRFKEFQKIHRLQDERALLEKELGPAKKKLSQIAIVLDEKYEKKRILENFHNSLAEHCAQDMFHLKDRTDEARAERSQWDYSDLDIGEQLWLLPLDPTEMKSLEQQVYEIRETLRNQKLWYDEEMHTKLFYSTRSKEIKQRIACLKNLIRRLEKAGYSEDLIEEIEEKRFSYRPEQILVDGTPGVHAKEVERYLSHQFGLKVLADYTMLRRLKDEIGVQGLAYLVEKVRLQSSKFRSNTAPSASCMEWEEKQIEQALMGIALEYRDRAEHRKMLRAPGVNSEPTRSENKQQSSLFCDYEYPSVSYITSMTPRPGRETPENSLGSSGAESRSSSLSLKKRTSLARIKKFLKL
ncbi:hypothetical protein BsWGS_12271 [Bradybaena similaris]